MSSEEFGPIEGTQHHFPRSNIFANRALLAQMHPEFIHNDDTVSPDRVAQARQEIRDRIAEAGTKPGSVDTGGLTTYMLGRARVLGGSYPYDLKK